MTVPHTYRELRRVGSALSDRNVPAHRPSDPAFYSSEVLVVPVPAGEAWKPGDLLQWAIVEDSPAPSGWPALQPIVTYEPRRYRVLSVNRVGLEPPKAVVKAVPIDSGRTAELEL